MSRRRAGDVATRTGPASTSEASRADAPGAPIVPLSPEQRRFLKTVKSCLTREEMQTAFSVYAVVTLDRRCGRREILDALRRLLETYDALRLVVEPEGDEFVQRLHPVDDRAIESVTRFHDDLQAHEVVELMSEYVGVPIPFARPLMVRVYALSEITGRTAVMLMFSHVVADGMSAQIIRRRLEQFLKGESRSERVNEASFVDYCIARSRADDRELMAASRRFWFEMFDRPYRPFAFARINDDAPVNYLYRDDRPPEDLKGLAERLGVRAFSLSFFAFAITVAIHAGRNDVVINYFSHGRQGTDLKSAVGCYYVPLPLRFTAKADEPLDTALRSFEGAVRGGIANQRYDVSMLVDELFGGVTHPAENNFPLTTLAFNGFSIKDVGVRTHDRSQAAQWGALPRHVRTARASLYDATFYVGLDDPGAQLSAGYRADKFIPEEIDRWSEVFWRVVAAIRDQRAARVGELLRLGEPFDGRRLWTRA